MAAETNETVIEKKEKRKAGDIISTVVLVLCILFVIFCSYTAYTASAGSGVPSIFGIRIFSIQSDSMAPFFEQGDLVIDRKVDNIDDLQVGDVITFWTYINGQKVLNTHRIQEINAGESFTSFVTKGDNNAVADTYTVHQNEVVGIYKTHIKNLGTVLDFLQTSKGFLICLVIPLAIFFVYEITTFFKTLSAYNKEKIRLQIEEEKKKNDELTKAAIAAALAAAGLTKAAEDTKAPEKAPEAAPEKVQEPVPEAAPAAAAAEAAPKAEAEPAAEVKEEPAAEAKEEPAAEVKEEPEAEAKEEPEAEAKEEPVTEAKEEPEAEAKEEPVTEAKEEPAAETKAEPAPEAEAEAEPEEKAEPAPEAEAGTAPEAETAKENEKGEGETKAE